MKNKIKAAIFDLDGTLVQTEILKAHAYGKAMQIISEDAVKEEEVVAAFGEFVGRSRNEIAEKLIEKYSNVPGGNHLQHVPDVLEKLIETRLSIYHEMIFDASVLHGYACPFSINLLKRVKSEGYTIGLATMSYQEQVSKVLNTLNLESYFNHIITRDTIEHGKPHPEIYLKMLQRMNVAPDEAVIIEDSVAGIKAAQAAGITVFGVTNSITRNSVINSNILSPEFIVDAAPELIERVFNYIHLSQAQYNQKNTSHA